MLQHHAAVDETPKVPDCGWIAFEAVQEFGMGLSVKQKNEDALRRPR